MLKNIDEDEKLMRTLFLSGQNRDAWLLTEDGVHEVLMQSRKPIAKEYKKEVKRILKQIRLTGGFVAEDREAEFIELYFPQFSDDTKLIMTLDLHKQNAAFRKQIAEQKPLVDFANQVSNSADLIDMNRMAKLLNDEHINIGRNRLFQWLRDKNILMANNVPYQRYVDNGYFKLKEGVSKTPYGDKAYTTTYVTGKGQIYITEKIRDEYKQ